MVVPAGGRWWLGVTAVHASLRCGDEIHSIEWEAGAFALCDHNNDDIAAEEVVRTLGSPIRPCVAIAAAWHGVGPVLGLQAGSRTKTAWLLSLGDADLGQTVAHLRFARRGVTPSTASVRAMFLLPWPLLQRLAAESAFELDLLPESDWRSEVVTDVVRSVMREARPPRAAKPRQISVGREELRWMYSTWVRGVTAPR